jgi:NAD(P)-dependent dehydrogenase (short-subunit alcohol dehydrogenase family)
MTRDDDGGTTWLEGAARSYPMPRAGTPEEVARLALYLASDESGWTTGSALPLDGGFTAV